MEQIRIDENCYTQKDQGDRKREGSKGIEKGREKGEGGCRIGRERGREIKRTFLESKAKRHKSNSPITITTAAPTKTTK